MQSWEIKQICHDEGYDEGYDKGYGIKLLEDVNNLMNNLHLNLQEACDGLGTTVAEYEKAKKNYEEDFHGKNSELYH